MIYFRHFRKPTLGEEHGGQEMICYNRIQISSKFHKWPKWGFDHYDSAFPPSGFVFNWQAGVVSVPFHIENGILAPSQRNEQCTVFSTYCQYAGYIHSFFWGGGGGVCVYFACMEWFTLHFFEIKKREKNWGLREVKYFCWFLIFLWLFLIFFVFKKKGWWCGGDFLFIKKQRSKNSSVARPGFY